MTEKKSRVTYSTIFALCVVLGLCGWGTVEVQAALGPTLSSDTVVYRWAPPEEGGGLIAIDDLVNGKSLLDAGRELPTWWRVKLKDGQTVSNTDLPCKIATRGGFLTFTWTGDVRVTVTARLDDDGALLRSRISVEAIKEGVGLRDVVFPVIDGIRPLSTNAADDRLLLARRTGYTSPTPLITGKAENYRYCIEYYMQFTALLGDDRGLYIGEHDPTAAWKDTQWSANAQAQTLTYDISHPVLDWGSDAPVRQYESPGDCVIGPFEGDWFDVACIYRKW
ncbi:MAG: hypothetical protein ACKJSG_17120, partial [Lentisphaeria bacterium]